MLMFYVSVPLITKPLCPDEMFTLISMSTIL